MQCPACANETSSPYCPNCGTYVPMNAGGAAPPAGAAAAVPHVPVASDVFPDAGAQAGPYPGGSYQGGAYQSGPSPSGPYAGSPYPGGPYPGTPVVTTEADSRNWAMGVHLSALAGYVVPFGTVVAPLVIWLAMRDRSPLIDAAGKQALNFHLTCLIAEIVFGMLSFIYIGLPFLFATLIAELVFTVIAAVKTNSGEAYTYPLAIRFFS